MRRIVAILVVLACGAGALVASGAADDDNASRYTVELDNAFGLVQGGDLKVAGVRAGTITDLRVDPRSKRALVDFEVTKRGFGSLRTDTFCESRPQSLIGEYFLDCDPGTAKRELPRGATIPVSRTASTVPLDLLNNVLRRPYRERLRIIVAELGTGVGARGEDLNAAIRRLSPALRETNKVLALLAKQNRTLVRLAEDADTVIGDLAGNRRDVGRWVVETRETAAASAERRAELAAGFRRLPGFLRELRPTMASLGEVADRQGPALADLSASAGELERLFGTLPAFARSTQVNVRSLAATARTGRGAVNAARPTVAQLAEAAAKAPELANNLDIVLRDLDDRGKAVEDDPRSPGGKGYTGLEALLTYLHDQAMAINIYDDNGYILKVNGFEDKCAEYQNAESIKEAIKGDPDFLKDCLADVGPNQPGVTTPDPTARPESAARRTRRSSGQRRRRTAKQRERPRTDDRPKKDDQPKGDGKTETPAPADQLPLPGPLRDALDDLLRDAPVPEVPGVPPLPGVPGGKDGAPALPDLPGANRDAMLDYLFGR